MKKIPASDIAERPIDDRLELVEDIWDSSAEGPDSISVPKWHKCMLEGRLEAYHANPTEGSPWGAVKESLLGE